VQYVAGLAKMAENPGFWASEADYVAGYTAITEWEACLMTTCLNVLLDKQDDMYRLLNTVLRGESYTVVTLDPLVVSPEIAHTVDLGFVDQNSVFGQLDRMTQLVDNSINGTTTPLYTYDPSVKALLQSIIDGLASSDSDLLAQLEQIVILLG
jgi:hypothetical protein